MRRPPATCPRASPPPHPSMARAPSSLQALRAAAGSISGRPSWPEAELTGTAGAGGGAAGVKRGQAGGSHPGALEPNGGVPGACALSSEAAGGKREGALGQAPAFLRLCPSCRQASLASPAGSACRCACACSVLSDSSQPRGLQPASRLCPQGRPLVFSALPVPHPGPWRPRRARPSPAAGP